MPESARIRTVVFVVINQCALDAIVKISVVSHYIVTALNLIEYHVILRALYDFE